MGQSIFGQQRAMDDQSVSVFGYAISFVSLACIIVPLIGAVARDGAVFLFGGLFAPFVGIIVGAVGLRAYRKPRTWGQVVASTIAITVNGCVETFFVWLIFIHGIN
jgi:hypothetical protein